MPVVIRAWPVLGANHQKAVRLFCTCAHLKFSMGDILEIPHRLEMSDLQTVQTYTTKINKVMQYLSATVKAKSCWGSKVFLHISRCSCHLHVNVQSWYWPSFHLWFVIPTWETAGFTEQDFPSLSLLIFEVLSSVMNLTLLAFLGVFILNSLQFLILSFGQDRGTRGGAVGRSWFISSVINGWVAFIQGIFIV